MTEMATHIQGFLYRETSPSGEQWLVDEAGAELVNVHTADVCAGPACTIHRPSDHAMKDWPLVWRQDRMIFERICPDHGVGHPDPDCLHNGDSGVHGCCGCCGAND